MDLDAAAGPAVYELVVEGDLGPMLRATLQPDGTARTQPCTIFRAEPTQDRDLVDLVLLLHSKGLDVEGVFRVDARGE